MLTPAQIQENLTKLVVTLKEANTNSQHLVASAAARAVEKTNGSVMNNVLEALRAIDKPHFVLALTFVKTYFPLVASTYVKDGEKEERNGVKYSKKVHTEKFDGLSFQELYDKAMEKSYAVEKERKERVIKTAAERHEAALAIIQKCEKSEPGLVVRRFAFLGEAQGNPKDLLEALQKNSTSEAVKKALANVRVLIEAEAIKE